MKAVTAGDGGGTAFMKADRQGVMLGFAFMKAKVRRTMSAAAFMKPGVQRSRACAALMKAASIVAVVSVIDVPQHAAYRCHPEPMLVGLTKDVFGGLSGPL